MINSIHIKNYILIDDLTIDFSSGLNVITGETGAGKSIIINAIDIALGAKVSSDVIKNNAEKAVIELFISAQNHDMLQMFEDNGIDYSEEIVISREITANSSRIRINGTIVNLAFIKEFKNLILDIHSQHETYAFLQPKTHIVLLDNYSKEIYGKQLVEYKNLYSEYLSLTKDLEKFKKIAEEAQNQIDFLDFQIKEIENANIVDINEEEELKNELKILENAESLKESTYSIYWALNGDDGNIIDALQKIKAEITRASRLDEDLTSTEEQLIDTVENLKDIAGTLRSYSESVSDNAERLDEIQERLYIFNKLKRKYGNSLEEILSTYEKLSKELESIELSGQKAEETKQKIEIVHKQLTELANFISENRQKEAKSLSKQVEQELEKLELPKARFEIRVKQTDLCSNGCDDVEFFITTNVSNDLAPLAKTASGGEISRVMLAIKTIFAQADNIDTVIFDEIDTGISGKAALSVSEEIANLAKFRQILLITHQAIIAAKANKHFLVTKNQGEETNVDIKALTDDEKVFALAGMASGGVDEHSLEFARTLLEKNN